MSKASFSHICIVTTSGMGDTSAKRLIATSVLDTWALSTFSGIRISVIYFKFLGSHDFCCKRSIIKPKMGKDQGQHH